MRTRLLIAMVVVMLTALLLSAVWAQPADVVAASTVRFAMIDVMIDSHEIPLAAYQCELAVKKGDALIVGIEGGAPAVFQDPPHYDPAALLNKHIILAAFTTSDNLPKGQFRIARLHLQITGPATETPDYAIQLTLAADRTVQRIPATVSVRDAAITH